VETLFRRNESGQIVEHLLSIEALKSTLTMFEASNPHDIVYAMLGLAQDTAVNSERRQSAMYPDANLSESLQHTRLIKTAKLIP
jgi:hypothetical protein